MLLAHRFMRTTVPYQTQCCCPPSPSHRSSLFAHRRPVSNTVLSATLPFSSLVALCAPPSCIFTFLLATQPVLSLIIFCAPPSRIKHSSFVEPPRLIALCAPSSFIFYSAVGDPPRPLAHRFLRTFVRYLLQCRPRPSASIRSSLF